MTLTYLLLFLMQQATPEINLSKNQWNELPETHFHHATDGHQAKQTTLVKLKYDDDYLYIDFECQQNPFWKENSYHQHNSEMWNQEVFELFIAEGEATPTRYLEIEINPNNALFVGWIDNPTKETPQKLTFVPYENAGITHRVEASGATWSGKVRIPWTLLGSKKDTYRLNFYRIISRQSHSNSDWKCTSADCDFTCWSPSLSGATPRFHRPDVFGTMKLH